MTLVLVVLAKSIKIAADEGSNYELAVSFLLLAVS